MCAKFFINFPVLSFTEQIQINVAHDRTVLICIARELVRAIQFYDAEVVWNVALGARYLAMMLRQFDGDRIAALAAYNAGPGRPLRWRKQAPPLTADETLLFIGD